MPNLSHDALLFSATAPQVDNFAIRSPIPRIEDALTPVTMYLDCSGTGDPIPTYQFKRNGVIITDEYPDKRLTVIDNTLRISNLNTSDGGFYICLATNQDGTVLKELDVKLRGMLCCAVPSFKISSYWWLVIKHH